MGSILANAHDSFVCLCQSGRYNQVFYMAKRARTTKKQIEAMVGFLEKEKHLLYGGDSSVWQTLQGLLTNIDGPQRTVKQWKAVLGDLETKV
ncbi:hypothetical protein QE152_g30309 [Popillia japonica]|uniref:Uncharacterized protein n=1 Tax=Popillia japonica TaxID=7064 RepID=A0AAW1JF99_POPJA